jgi:hypothetical protein
MRKVTFLISAIVSAVVSATFAGASACQFQLMLLNTVRAHTRLSAEFRQNEGHAGHGSNDKEAFIKRADIVPDW